MDYIINKLVNNIKTSEASYIYRMACEELKSKKERFNNYEEKVVIKGTLDDVLKVSVPKPNVR